MDWQKTVRDYADRRAVSFTARERIALKLAFLVHVIASEFDGEVRMEKLITERMTRRYRWGNKTTRRCLDMLCEIGILRCERARDHWTKVFTLRSGVVVE